MADYARRDDFARFARGQAEQMRRQRTQRPRRGHVKTLTWIMEGEATEDRLFPRRSSRSTRSATATTRSTSRS